MTAIEVRELLAEEWPIAAALSARALQTNPGMVWMLGEDPLQRTSDLYAFSLRARESSSVTFGAWCGQLLVGVAHMARPESCLGAVGRKMGPPPPFNGDEPEGLARVPHGMALIDENDPDGSHWHLGPVAVEPGFQGRGVGHKVLAPAIARIVSDRDLGWLETDKPENVRFYPANGFAVVHHEVRFGVDYWFMSLES